MDGWMVGEQEILFHSVPVLWLTLLLAAVFYDLLKTHEL
jgi:hypothetical protein